jgi:tRNA 2-thiouridine synthesizing protein A
MPMSSGHISNTDVDEALMLDASGLRCPMPLLKTRQQLRQMESGQRLRVIASDPGARRDIPAWLGQAGHKLVHIETQGESMVFLIEAGEAS